MSHTRIPQRAELAAYIPSVEKQTWITFVSIISLVIISALLRHISSLGELWLDEIWTLRLLRQIDSVYGIFIGINHDNNHFLNSLYIYSISSADALSIRYKAVIFGSLSVAAAFIATPGTFFTKLVAGILFAISFMMVQYGSEARGYAGFILATIISIWAVDRIINHQKGRFILAAAILLGFLSHLIMVATVANLVIWHSWSVWQRTRKFRSVNEEVGWAFGPAFVAVLPLALCMLVGRTLYGFSFGGISAFTVDAFAFGYAEMVRHLLGIGSGLSDWTIVVLVLIGTPVLIAMSQTQRGSLYIGGIVAIPLLMAAFNVPNLEFPRYFLLQGVLILLLLAEAIGRLLERAAYRWIGLIVVFVFVFINISNIVDFQESRRGNYANIVETIMSSGESEYASNHVLQSGFVVEYLAQGKPQQPVIVRNEHWCTARPRWFIQVGRQAGGPLPIEQECGVTYERVTVSQVAGLSGQDWGLYRRAE